jgi:hypothetical protein
MKNNLIIGRCIVENSSHIRAFMAILHKTMTSPARHTLHHQAHAHHQRQLQSVSSTGQTASAYAALDGIRATIDRECEVPVLYTGCGAAQCICLSAALMTVVSLLPTIPLSASKNSINISSVMSARCMCFVCKRAIGIARSRASQSHRKRSFHSST